MNAAADRRLLAQVRQIALRAGTAIMEIYTQPFSPKPTAHRIP
jgi:hypothetical protein